MGNVNATPAGISPLTPSTSSSASTPSAGLPSGGEVAAQQQQQSLFRPYQPKASLNLLAKGRTDGLPLQRLSVEGDLVDLCARLTITQVFVNNVDTTSADNDEAGGLECIYTFPVEDLSSVVATYSCPLVVCGVEVEIGGNRVVAEVQPKQDAINTYDDAISSGHGAYLVEKVQGVGYRMSIGNLPPGQTATITLQCVQQLTPLLSGDLQFAMSHGLVPASCSDFSLALDIRQTTPGGIKSVICPTHPECNIVLDGGRAKAYMSSTRVLADDVVFEICPHSPHEPNALVEIYAPPTRRQHNKQHEDLTHPQAAMLTFHPRWEVEPDVIKHRTELIFLIDRSGSMSGSRMDIAKATLQLFLRSLPEGVRFNIFSFGSSYSSLFDTSVPYSEESLEHAQDHVQGMSADMGGTTLHSPLQQILHQPEHQGFSRQIFLLTDGDVDNTDQVIQLVREQAGTTRIFTFAIGNEADKNMLQELALCGRGAMEFVSDVALMKAQVMRQLQKALEPTMTITKLRLLSRDGSDQHWRCTSSTIRPIFSGERLVLYAFSRRQRKWSAEHELVKAELMGVSPTGEEVVFELLIDGDHTTSGCTLHQLAAISRISRLRGNDAERCKKLGLAYSLATAQTSFVAVEERDRATLGTMRKFEEHGAAGKKANWSTTANRLSQQDVDLDQIVQHMRQMHDIALSIGAEIETQSCLLDRIDDNVMQAQTELVSASSFRRSAKSMSWGIGSFFSGLAAAVTSPFSQSSVSKRSSSSSSSLSSTSSSSSTSQQLFSAEEDAVTRGTADSHCSAAASLERLVMLQRANGTWTLEAMEGFLKVALPLPALLASADDQEVASLVWATSVALAVLERVFSDKRDEWRLLAQKATSWLKRSVDSSVLSQLAALSRAIDLPHQL